MGFIQITPRNFLAIMDAVRTFSTTSYSFTTAHAALAERMARVEAALVHHTTILEQIVHPKIVYNQIFATITQEVLSNPKAKVPKTCSPIFMFVMDQNTYTNL